MSITDAIPVGLERDTLYLGPSLSVTFQRTLRLPDDGSSYPLPPGLGAFPLRRVEDYVETVPATWRRRGGVFLPMYQREAMWLAFGSSWPPVALKVGVGEVNAVSGGSWDESLNGQVQDYVVCPDQPWLDGINSGEGTVRQFVAMPLGSGYTVEAQLTGEESVGGLQLQAFEAHPDRVPRRRPVIEMMACACSEMGLAAGGRMTQEIYADDYGIETWDQSLSASVFVHIADSPVWREITGEELPSTPVSARTYTQHGLPWFSLYDEARRDITPSATLTKVKSVGTIDGVNDPGLAVPPEQTVRLGWRE